MINVRKTFYSVCQICGRRPRASYNRPKSLHKTKRMVYPNLQKWGGKLICTRCLRTLAAKI
ncbi:50S ribosomal protein L28 [Candidatus Berkelbacteria bacterium]|nr:50S ribosomal protein L28 [Candidatus Berkelbacteria bacterium]